MTQINNKTFQTLLTGFESLRGTKEEFFVEIATPVANPDRCRGLTFWSFGGSTGALLISQNDSKNEADKN